jgi:cytoskeletal protein CcmA (bactofilin family)
VNPYFSVTALFLLAATLCALPLLPSLIEFCRKSDVLPLKVVQQHAGEVAYFAHSFRTYIHAIQSALEQCSATGNTATGVMPDGAEFLVLGRGEDALTLPLSRPDGSCPFVLASSTALLLPPDMTFTRDIYANGRFIGGDRNRYRAVLAEKEAHIGSGSRVARWMHAGGQFIAEPECHLLGRVSSDSLIRLKTQSRFVRLNAPRIETGPSAPDASIGSLPRRTVDVASQRVLHNGDFVVNAGETFHGDLVVRGRLRICERAHVHGSVKSEKDMLLEAEVVVNGSVITERKMRIGAQCVLRGPIIAERTLYIATGTRCGSPEKQTTVSAQRIMVEEGVVVCGTIWAREQGRVMATV